jgi:hypothetical protein
VRIGGSDDKGASCLEELGLGDASGSVGGRGSNREGERPTRVGVAVAAKPEGIVRMLGLCLFCSRLLCGILSEYYRIVNELL